MWVELRLVVVVLAIAEVTEWGVRVLVTMSELTRLLSVEEGEEAPRRVGGMTTSCVGSDSVEVDGSAVEDRSLQRVRISQLKLQSRKILNSPCRLNCTDVDVLLRAVFEGPFRVVARPRVVAVPSHIARLVVGIERSLCPSCRGAGAVYPWTVDWIDRRSNGESV